MNKLKEIIAAQFKSGSHGYVVSTDLSEKKGCSDHYKSHLSKIMEVISIKGTVG